jgi:putative glutamine amidotransferase
MRKPMVGVVPLFDEDRDSYWMVPGYMKGIEQAGGIPVMLPLTDDEEVIRTLAKTFDGFLFTGGQDVNPAIYGEKMEAICGKPCDMRDRMEAILFKESILLDKPVLGICRGIQLFNALLGGTLYQDLSTQWHPEIQILHKQKPPYDHHVHRVSIIKDSPLYAIFQSESLSVNSYHHQGINKLSNQLACAATAEDGLIEAVYMPQKRWVVAVQWHPEFIFEKDRGHYKLFQEFVFQVSVGCSR